jgi:hypothetical protein
MDVGKNVPAEGYHGGIIFDEMALQEDIQIDNRGGSVNLSGLVEYGRDGDNMDIIIHGKKSAKLATHVLQMEFLGHTGFVFPFASYPCDQAQPYHLYSLFWEAVNSLMKINLYVEFTIFDGAVANRSFLKMLFTGDPIDANVKVVNLFRPSKTIVVAMEPKHVIKRIRNNIFNSGNHQRCTRNMIWHDLPIVWDHWRAAYYWDKDNNPEMMRVHHKLTDEHIELSGPRKVRNHLAEDCLNDIMLNLMINYQKSLMNGKHLDGSIELLKQTSKMVAIYNDNRPICDINDERLVKLADCKKWFADWTKHTCTNVSHSRSVGRMLISRETQEDVQYCITGFASICRLRLESGHSVLPSRINSDIVENVFSQQRGSHGDNTNPKYLQYTKNVNNIVLSQSSKTVSKKSNVCMKGAVPFNFTTPRPLQKSRK